MDTQPPGAEIGVALQAGTVSLSGYVNAYAMKTAAERAAKKVKGVREVTPARHNPNLLR